MRYHGIAMAAPTASVAAYLEGLPHGLASYPECTAKASLLRDMLATRPLDPDSDSLLEDLRPLIRDPPPVSTWIPEVAFVASAMTVYDEHFGGHDVAGFEQWIVDFNAALFRKPLYRVLFALISPERLVVGATTRWSAFHRGTSLALVERGQRSGLVRVGFPPDLYGTVMLHGFAAGLRAAVVVAGGRDVRTELESIEATSAEYWIRWKR
jgi:uncharacterized protein (TIGR02265 family)